MSTAAVSRIPVAQGRNPRAKWSLVSIETEMATYVGQVFVPETKKRLSDVLCDERPFVNLIEVSINGRQPPEAFVALNKTCIRTVRVLQDETGRPSSEGD